VLEDFDGKRWQVHPERKLARQQYFHLKQEFSPQLAGRFLQYEVMAEPTQQRWLFALDLAVPDGATSNAEILQSDDYQLIRQRPLTTQYQYRIKSYPEALSLQTPRLLDKRLNLTTPLNSNPRTRQWVAALRQQYPQDSAFVSALLNYFVQQDFRYTLRPETMYTDPVDQFLFDKQAGFCSHYASALAYSLRLGGIPARVVAGYQGGEINANDQAARYLSVYQYDAHAWVEAWGDATGWMRLDPTGLVAPDRINFGLQHAMRAEGSFLADSFFSLTKLANIAWLNTLRLTLADIDYHWSRWVLGYDSQTQMDLFISIIGKVSHQRLAFLGLGVVALIAALLGLFFLPHCFSKRLAPSHRYYQQALALLAKNCIHRKPWQGALDFSDRAREKLPPKSAQTFTLLSEVYLQLEYQAWPPDTKHGKDSMLATKTKAEVRVAHRMMRKYLNQLKAQLTCI
jgi:transglutaminase-like putative cysteine protease